MLNNLINKIKIFFSGDSASCFTYRGYRVYFGAGSSLIKQIKQSANRIYEEDEIIILKKFIGKQPFRKVIDVGSNIGLFSINLLKDFSPEIIYAFEPGPTQFKSFELTIAENNLSKKISLTKLALSNKVGIARFSAHNEFDNSGDGFIDTGRAGEGLIVEVETQTLDNYWDGIGSVQIDFIKIDTEGAELWVLEGAKKLIETCKPLLLVEIFHLNLKAYPHTSDDIFALFEDLNYSLYNSALVKLTAQELKEQHHTQGMFYAKSND